MTLFLMTFGLFLLVVVAMALGYLMQRKTIGGSCGGLDALGIDKACDCADPCEARKNRLAKEKFWQENKIV
ncbi:MULTISPECIES: (Na+)-NQR maturation NqrM [Rheinheimera]|uniref:(Na+)-NQR maturation NqrM n=1 Tax=Rheinheimera TaxID=67575 RepID=UPI0010526213|nr:(Na+)-NQR maturation NqrM [Rheinheimera sp. D18]QBL08705.1 (Na+)-NQR maturation NqrM [Rheinheimera sp. D18]